MIDNLPAAAVLVAPDGSDLVQYEHGHRLGTVRIANRANSQENTAFLNNHLKFTVKYNTDEEVKKHRWDYIGSMREFVFICFVF